VAKTTKKQGRQRALAPVAAADYRVNMVMLQALGLRTLRSVGANSSVYQVVCNALDALAVQPGEMVELTFRRLKTKGDG